MKAYLSKMKKVLTEAIGIAKALKRTLIFAFAISPVDTGVYLGTTIILNLTPILQSYLGSKAIDEALRIISVGGWFTQALITVIVLGIAISIFEDVINSIQSYFDYNRRFTFALEFDYLVTKKLAYLEDQYLDNPEISTLRQKVWENYGHRPQGFIDATFDMFASIASGLSSLLIVIAYSPIFFVLAIVATLPSLVNNLIIGRSKWNIWDATSSVRKDYSYTRWYVSSKELLGELRIFGLREPFLKRIRNLYTNFSGEERKLEIKRIKIGTVLDFVATFGSSAINLLLLVDVLRRIITIGSFNFYRTQIARTENALRSLTRIVRRLHEHGIAMVEIYKFLDLPQVLLNGQVLLHGDVPPVIEFKNIKFSYPGANEKALDGIDLTIKPGEHIAIVGENGAGKSSLIKLLLRFYDPTEGSVLIDGTDLPKIDINSWYKRVGSLFQKYNDYHFDAKTNIGVGDYEKKDDIDRIVEMAKISDAHEFITKYPKKYDTILDKAFEGGVMPSVGQWQRIALARVFFKNPPVLILDEPTSAIDPKAEHEIFSKLFNFAKGKTVIIISHRFSTVRNASRILVLDKGKIIEDGSHEELMKITNGKYRTAFEIQRKGYE